MFVKIKKLVLSGYKRLMLNNIRKITYTPESVFQIILGTNGCGKSSVLYELSPLPAQPNDYVNNGYKEIEIEHNGHEYILRSTFKSTNKHEFIKDGENLNPGGTVTVQRELVKNDFKIDQEIHELLVGLTNFTSLAPIKRREWITKLCNVDFDYAISVFRNVKSGARDTQGALKHVKNRIADETTKLTNIGDTSAIDKKYDELHQDINILFQELDGDCRDSKELKRELFTLLKEVELNNHYLITKVPPNPKMFTSLEDIDAYINTLNTEKQVQEEVRKRITKEYGELLDILEKYKEAGVDDIKVIKTQLNEMHAEKNRLVSTIENWTMPNYDCREAETSLREIVHELLATMKSLPANINGQFSRDRVKRAGSLLPDIRKLIERTRNKISFYENKIEEAATTKKSECPKCKYEWIPGVTDRELQEYSLLIKSHRQELFSNEIKEEKIVKFQESAEYYTDYFRKFHRMTTQYPRLKSLWDIILNSELLYTDPPALVGAINSFVRELSINVSIQEVMTKIDRLDKILEISKDSNSDSVRSRTTKLHEELEAITIAMEFTGNDIFIFNKHRQHVRKYLDKTELYEKHIGQISSLINETIRSFRTTEINSTIRSLQNQLAIVQSKQSAKNALENILKDLNNDDDNLSFKNHALNLIANELSPFDGLIAEQLIGFIESFVAYINQIIESIWTYEMKVIPCGLESGDLDYKFPLYIQHEGKELEPPDISKGSEAQVEIINLAFRLITLVYLGLEEYPIYLDECGRAFDEQHRINLMTFIKKLIDNGNHTQLFMISHYAAFHGSFTQAEVMVLDGTNITVPKVHNNHVILE